MKANIQIKTSYLSQISHIRFIPQMFTVSCTKFMCTIDNFIEILYLSISVEKYFIESVDTLKVHLYCMVQLQNSQKTSTITFPMEHFLKVSTVWTNLQWAIYWFKGTVAVTFDDFFFKSWFSWNFGQFCDQDCSYGGFKSCIVISASRDAFCVRRNCCTRLVVQNRKTDHFWPFQAKRSSKALESRRFWFQCVGPCLCRRLGRRFRECESSPQLPAPPSSFMNAY